MGAVIFIICGGLSFVALYGAMFAGSYAIILKEGLMRHISNITKGEKSLLVKIFFSTIFSFEINDRGIEMFIKLLEDKCKILLDGISNLSQLKEDFKNEEKKDLGKISKKTKKIFILGNEDLEKSSLVNSIEGKTLIKRAKKIKYKQYISDKYKDYIFLDAQGKMISKISKFEKNMKITLEEIKNLDSCYFWYLKKSGKNFDKYDVQNIKLMHNILKEKFPLPILIAIEKEANNKKDIEKLEQYIKEQLLEIDNITIVPSFDIDELIKKTKIHFTYVSILKKIFKSESFNKFHDKILQEWNNFFKSFDISLIGKILFELIRSIELEPIFESLNYNQKDLMENFLSEKLSDFIFSNFIELISIFIAFKSIHENIFNSSNFSENSQLVDKKFKEISSQYLSDVKTKSEIKNYLIISFYILLSQMVIDLKKKLKNEKIINL